MNLVTNTYLPWDKLLGSDLMRNSTLSSVKVLYCLDRRGR